jgi:hypothetical protein
MVTLAGQARSPFSAVILCPLGGAVSRMDSKSMALAIPATDWMYFCEANSRDSAEQDCEIIWVKQFLEAMRPWSVDQAPPNLLEPDEGTRRVRASFGEEKFNQLVQLKERYDPNNVFSLNVNIPPRRESHTTAPPPRTRPLLRPTRNSAVLAPGPRCSRVAVPGGRRPLRTRVPSCAYAIRWPSGYRPFCAPPCSLARTVKREGCVAFSVRTRSSPPWRAVLKLVAEADVVPEDLCRLGHSRAHTVTPVTLAHRREPAAHRPDAPRHPVMACPAQR